MLGDQRQLISLYLLRVCVHAEVIADIVFLAGCRSFIVVMLYEVIILPQVFFDSFLFESQAQHLHGVHHRVRFDFLIHLLVMANFHCVRDDEVHHI